MKDDSGLQNLPDLGREERYLLWVHPVALFQCFRVLLVINEFVLHRSHVPKPSLQESLRCRRALTVGGPSLRAFATGSQHP